MMIRISPSYRSRALTAVEASVFVCFALSLAAALQVPSMAQSVRMEAPQLLKGPLNAPEVGGIYMVDGTIYRNVASAISACLTSSSSACTIDARGSGRLGKSADVIGPFDPKNKALTLELGPYGDYTVDGSITMESGLTIIGTGSNTGSSPGTVVHCTNTSAPCLQFPSGNSKIAVTHMLLRGVSFVGTGSGTQDGIHVDLTNCTNCQYGYSTWDDILLNSFRGRDISLVGRASDGSSAIQFNKFVGITAMRIPGASFALYLAGSVGNNQFIGGEFDDGPFTTNGTCQSGGEVYIGADGRGTQDVYSELFSGTTIQGGSFLIEFHGAEDITLQGLHHEGCNKGPVLTNGYLFTLGGSQNRHITVAGSDFAGNIGTGPNGYIFNTSGSGNALDLAVTNSSWGGANKVVIGPLDNSAQALTFDHNFGESHATNGAVVQQIQAAAILNSGLMRFVTVSGQGDITAIHSRLMPGELLLIRAGGPGSLNFRVGGNLNLEGRPAYTLRPGQIATFTWNDRAGKEELVGLLPQ